MKIILETQRLTLREFLEVDSENMFQLNSDPEVIRYTGDDPFSSAEEAKSFIQHYDNQYDKFGYGRWTILLKDTDEYLGWCGLSYHVDTTETDLGFRLMKKNWSNGFATEAVQKLPRLWFSSVRIKKDYWAGHERQ